MLERDFFQAIVLILVGVVATGVMGFLVWQIQGASKTLTDVRERLIGIEKDVKSLLQTRKAGEEAEGDT